MFNVCLETSDNNKYELWHCVSVKSTALRLLFPVFGVLFHSYSHERGTSTCPTQGLDKKSLKTHLLPCLFLPWTQGYFKERTFPFQPPLPIGFSEIDFPLPTQKKTLWNALLEAREKTTRGMTRLNQHLLRCKLLHLITFPGCGLPRMTRVTRRGIQVR